MDDLSRRWPLAGRDGLRERLLAAYRDPARGYHDARHLAEVLEHVESLLADGAEGPGGAGAAGGGPGGAGGGPADRDAVLLAAWFHDAVYEGRRDDEERSAVLAESELAGEDPALAAEVVRLVRLTATHRPQEGDANGKLLCDADLAILGAGPRRYREYVDGVRREYAHLADEDFARGRAAVLRDLLARPRLFHTDAARDRWERAARANAARELAELEG